MTTSEVMVLILARLQVEGRDIAFVSDEEINSLIESAINDILLAKQSLAVA